MKQSFSRHIENKSLLRRAIYEEETRRKESYKEFKSLFDSYLNIIKFENNQDLSVLVNDHMNYLKDVMSNVTIEWKNSYKAGYALRTHKNTEILECAISNLEKYNFFTSWEKLQEVYPMSEETPVYLGGTDTDYKGTSVMNCINMIMYATFDSLGKRLTFDVSHSPLIQTTALPEDSFGSDGHLYQDFKKSIFYHFDDNSPKQGELLYFNLGYTFAGSREDKRYDNKSLRAEDCSSSVAKWLDADKPFATMHLKKAYNAIEYNNKDYEEECKKDDYCMAVKKVLLPVPSYEQVEEGDVYIFKKGGHTGVVIKQINDTCFESLSYSRDVPFIEGLGYNVDCITVRDYLFMRPISETIDEL